MRLYFAFAYLYCRVLVWNVSDNCQDSGDARAHLGAGGKLRN